jgi:hypothetical protein
MRAAACVIVAAFAAARVRVSELRVLRNAAVLHPLGLDCALVLELLEERRPALLRSSRQFPENGVVSRG